MEKNGIVYENNNGEISIIKYNEESFDMTNLNLSRLFWNQKVISIEERAFCDCNKLEYVELTDSIKIIKKETFCNCLGLMHIRLPQCLRTVQEKAFFNCINLESMKFPASVIKIDENAFSKCVNLKYAFVPRGCDEGFKELIRKSIGNDIQFKEYDEY